MLDRLNGKLFVGWKNLNINPLIHRHGLRWLALLTAALPAVLPFWLILKYGVDTPYWDQWDRSLAGLYVKAAHSELKWTDFTAQHNEHRILVPRVFGYLLNRVTRWNNVGEMLMQWVVVCATSVCILWLGRQTVGGGRLDGRVIFCWFLSNLMLFTPRQQENWLWGMGLINVMPLLFMMAAMAIIYSSLRTPVRVGAAVVLCALAMFSLGNGVLAFPLVGALLAWSASWKQLKAKRGILLVWGGAFALCLIMFAYGYSRPPIAENVRDKVVSFHDRALYYLVFLGNQFSAMLGLSAEDASFIIGGILLALVSAAIIYFLHLWLQRREMLVCSLMLPWCLIGSFVLISGLMATFFRTIVGLDNAVSSRYVTFTLYLSLALIYLTPLICQDLRARYPGRPSWPLERLWAKLPSALAGALVVAYLYTVAPALRNAELTSLGRRQAKAALQLIYLLPNNPKLARSVYPNIPQLREEAAELDKLGYFRPPILTDGNVNLRRDARYVAEDANKLGIFERLVEIRPGVLGANGWALKPENMTPPDAIVLTYLNDKQEPIIFAASEGIYARGDLIEDRRNTRYDLAGWSTSFPVTALPPDMGTVLIDAWALDAITCTVRPLANRLTVTRGPAAASR